MKNNYFVLRLNIMNTQIKMRNFKMANRGKLSVVDTNVLDALEDLNESCRFHIGVSDELGDRVLRTVVFGYVNNAVACLEEATNNIIALMHEVKDDNHLRLHCATFDGQIFIRELGNILTAYFDAGDLPINMYQKMIQDEFYKIHDELILSEPISFGTMINEIENETIPKKYTRLSWGKHSTVIYKTCLAYKPDSLSQAIILSPYLEMYQEGTEDIPEKCTPFIPSYDDIFAKDWVSVQKRKYTK